MRRLGPTWLRDLSEQQLHALGLKLLHDFQTTGLSPRQDWLLDRVSHELGWRMLKRRPSTRCTCALCLFHWVRDQPDQ